MTPAGIEPTTFRFVAQHLNHCATAVPQINVIVYSFYEELMIALCTNWKRERLVWNGRCKFACIAVNIPASHLTGKSEGNVTSAHHEGVTGE